MISLDDVKRAMRTIESQANRTPVMTSRTLDSLCGCRVFVKCENFQRAGAFKFRGAFNAVSSLDQDGKKAGVVTHSSGNHAQALALSAAIAGVKARIVMPEGSAAVKIQAVRGYGAEVILCANSLEAREKTTAGIIAEHGNVLIHPYNDERIMAGAGTAALELVEETGTLDLVLAPVGGGGLLSGSATAVKGLCPGAAVWGVEPSGADDAWQSFQRGEIVPQTNPRTIADGLRTSLGALTFEVIKSRVDRIVRVEDEDIIETMRFLWQRMKLVVEPSGAVPLVPVLKVLLPGKGLRVGVIVSGGNLDLDSFFAALAQTAKKLKSQPGPGPSQMRK